MFFDCCNSNKAHSICTGNSSVGLMSSSSHLRFQFVSEQTLAFSGKPAFPGRTIARVRPRLRCSVRLTEGRSLALLTCQPFHATFGNLSGFWAVVEWFEWSGIRGEQLFSSDHRTECFSKPPESKALQLPSKAVNTSHRRHSLSSFSRRLSAFRSPFPIDLNGLQ